MNLVSKTAYYCCGVRMQDAESPKPLIGDVYAKLFLGEEGVAYWQQFKHFKGPNASNTARHYIIDNMVKQLLSKGPGYTIILIGAGYDSRAFRLPSGNWVEVDEPSVIEYKNAVLPADICPNTLERISVNFATQKLADKLASYAGKEKVIIIIEGVLMYLSGEAKEELLKTVTTLFPKHVLFCDLMKKKFYEKFSHEIHKKLLQFGSSFTDMREDPSKMFLDYGYKNTESVSTIKTAIDLGLFRVPRFIVNLFIRKHFMGYAVYCFGYGFQAS